ncbi:oxidoreductase [Lentilactobacillus senioris]|uniref:oxidoreductase n=1 Tax=Lentilactobacillus senioris TaxID=931534 RepID=UPI003D2834A9
MERNVAIVTGASSGIGMQIAKNLKRNGFNVFGLARRVDKMNALDDLGINTMYLDVADEDSVDAAIKQIVAQTGRIDVLVNNAGYGSFGAVEEVPLEEGEYQFKVNVFGTMKMIQAVLPTMREQHSGRIINISSVDGKIAQLMGSWYVGSKFAIEGISDALRLELKPFGIDVIVVEPGVVASEWSAVAMDKLVDSSANGPYAGMARQAQNFMTATSQFASQPRVVARLVDMAAISRRPKTRYAGGAGAKLGLYARKVLPDRAMDALMTAMYRYTSKMVNHEIAINR